MAGLCSCVTNTPALITHSDTSSVVSSSRGKEALLAGCLVLLHYTVSGNSITVIWDLPLLLLISYESIYHPRCFGLDLRNVLLTSCQGSKEETGPDMTSSIKAESRSVMCRYVCTSATDDPLVSQSVFTITEKAPTIYGVVAVSQFHIYLASLGTCLA